MIYKIKKFKKNKNFLIILKLNINNHHPIQINLILKLMIKRIKN
jgi:hypothetical protein